MPISFKKGCVVLRGALDIEEAERLLTALDKDPTRQVDLAGLDSMHTAVLQVLLAKAPTCAIPPKNPVLAELLAPYLQAPQTN